MRYEAQYLLAMPMSHFEAIRQFLVSKLPNKPRKLHMKKLIVIFGSSRPSTKIKISPLKTPSKTESDRHQFCLKRQTIELHPNVIQITS